MAALCVRRMRRAARAWGGDIIESQKLYTRMSRMRGFTRCHDMTGVKIHYDKRLIITNGPIAHLGLIPNMAHEMWRVFGASYPPKHPRHNPAGELAWNLALMTFTGLSYRQMQRGMAQSGLSGAEDVNKMPERAFARGVEILLSRGTIKGNVAAWLVGPERAGPKGIERRMAWSPVPAARIKGAALAPSKSANPLTWVKHHTTIAAR